MFSVDYSSRSSYYCRLKMLSFLVYQAFYHISALPMSSEENLIKAPCISDCTTRLLTVPVNILKIVIVVVLSNNYGV